MSKPYESLFRDQASSGLRKPPVRQPTAPDKIGAALALAYDREDLLRRRLTRAFNAWDVAVRERQRLEKRMDRAVIPEQAG